MMSNTTEDENTFPLDLKDWGVGVRFRWCERVAAHDPRFTYAALAVAVVLARHFNPRNGDAWPSSRTISALTRFDRSNVRRALRELSQADYITSTDRRGRVNSYALSVPELASQLAANGISEDALVELEGAGEPPKGGRGNPHIGGQKAPEKGVREPPEQAYRRSESAGGKSVAPPRYRARSAGAPRARSGGQQKTARGIFDWGSE